MASSGKKKRWKKKNSSETLFFNSNFETEDKFPLKNIITVIGVYIHDIDNRKKVLSSGRKQLLLKGLNA